jgi:hypothetical protein
MMDYWFFNPFGHVEHFKSTNSRMKALTTMSSLKTAPFSSSRANIFTSASLVRGDFRRPDCERFLAESSLFVATKKKDSRWIYCVKES